MRSSLCLGLLAATAIVSAAAVATPITDTSATSVIDVEFWGRSRNVRQDPEHLEQDIISYGDPVQGSFRIWIEDAPEPNLTSIIYDRYDAVVYGRDDFPVADQPPASFVTSRWLSPIPAGFDGVLPFPGGEADDHVTIGDGVRFRPDQALQDWFQVSDGFTANFHEPNQSRVQLFITMPTPLDVIQGLGLNQEFELTASAETGDAGYGFIRNSLSNARRFFDFAVERLSVKKLSVCRP